MTVKFTNNASSSLSSGINSTATSLTVADASTFPSLSGADDYCYLTIQQATATTREVVKATARSGNTFTVQRGADNTTASAFSSGDTVELRLTAALLQDVIDQATVEGIKTNFQYIPTANQTQFSGADNSGDTMIINDSELVNVYMNGVRLVQGSDYTVSSANNRITLATGATTADVIDIEVFGNFTGQSGAAVAITGGAIAGTAITTGSINNTPIGGTQANTVAATTLTANSLAVDNIAVDGNEIDVSSGDLTLDVAGDITLDADSGEILLKDGGTEFGQLVKSGNDFRINQAIQDGDVVFRGNDGGSIITALTLDMSDGGTAIFGSWQKMADNNRIVFGAGSDLAIYSDGTNGNILVSGELIIDVDTQGSGNGILLKDAGTLYGSIFRSSSHLHIKAEAQDKNLLFLTNNGGSELTAMTIDSSGNVGVGVTPDTYTSSAYRAIQIAGYAYNIGHSGGDHYITNNAYINSGWKYGQTSTAQLIQMASGKIALYTAASGSADSAITWNTGLVQDSSGKVGIGTSSPSALLNVNTGSSGSHDAIVISRTTHGTVGTFKNAAGSLEITSNKQLVLGADPTNAFTAAGSEIQFQTDGTTKMTLSSGGNLGIGTPSPGFVLDVVGPVATNGAAVRNMLLYDTSSASQNCGGGITFGGNSNGTGGAVNDFATIQGIKENGTQGNYAGALRFSTRVNNGVPTERVRISSGGILLVGTTDTSPYNNNSDSTADNGISLSGDGWISNARYAGTVLYLNRTGSDGQILAFNRSGATRGEVAITTTSVQYYTTSDARLKDNIVDAPSASDDIDAIQVRSFDWKEDGSHQKYGMIAQELLPVTPEAVSQPEDPETMMSIDYSKLVPMLVKEIQSLRDRVRQLEDKND